MILLGVPSIIAHAQDEPDPRLAIDRLGARGGIPLAVNSEAFAARDPIPAAYTAEGGNIAPPIYWSPGPRGTRSFVVIAENEDARGGPHRLLWLVYDIPSEQTALGAGARLRVSRQRNGPVIALGRNSLGTLGYAGPRPTPAEGTHTYHFQVFALDTVLRAPDGASLPFVLGAMRSHVIAAGEIVGTFTAGRPLRVASDSAASSAAKKPPLADKDLDEAPAKPEPVREAPLKPEIEAATAEPVPPAPRAPPEASTSAPQAAAATPPAQEKPTPLLAPHLPAPQVASEKPAQVAAAERPTPLEPARTAPAPPARRAPTPAPTAPAASPSPFDALSSLFSSKGSPQPMAVPVWVSAYGPIAAQAPTAPKPGAATSAAAAAASQPISRPEAGPVRRPEPAKPAEPEPAKTLPAKPPEPDFVPSVFPPIELQPLPTDAWRIASERIGLPALPDVPPIREEPPPKEPETTIATAPPPAPDTSKPVPNSALGTTASTAPSKSAPAQAKPPSLGTPADLDFLKTTPPSETEPLPRPGRIIVADLSFLRLPELPPVAAPIRAPEPEGVAPPTPPESPQKLVPQPADEGRAPERKKTAPARGANTAPREPSDTSASPKPAKALTPASAPPKAIAKPRPSIPSLRPSSGSQPNGAGG